VDAHQRTQQTVSNGFSLATFNALINLTLMSLHSYSRIWLHLTWATLERRPLLSQPAAVKLSAYLAQYSAEKRINQEAHHRKRSFGQELRLLVERHGLEWRDDKTAEAVPIVSSRAATPR
jgi:hypothetical protein